MFSIITLNVSAFFFALAQQNLLEMFLKLGPVATDPVAYL